MKLIIATIVGILFLLAVANRKLIGAALIVALVVIGLNVPAHAEDQPLTATPVVTQPLQNGNLDIQFENHSPTFGAAFRDTMTNFIGTSFPNLYFFPGTNGANCTTNPNRFCVRIHDTSGLYPNYGGNAILVQNKTCDIYIDVQENQFFDFLKPLYKHEMLHCLGMPHHSTPGGFMAYPYNTETEYFVSNERQALHPYYGTPLS